MNTNTWLQLLYTPVRCDLLMIGYEDFLGLQTYRPSPALRFLLMALTSVTLIVPVANAGWSVWHSRLAW